ncbi:uncharacterized protein LOC143280370 [Babylonia areolata]|uniref:uncharacterized protein LOC143280370 n=1 Tax=Babylonia areolata TaxID=304850 RepID=UPI003FD38EC5
MLAVVTITYQEEAERTNKEVESEKASKRQRKQAVSAFYNMTKLATKQNVWARLIQENKMKEKEKESPLQKLVRMRAAINIWQKKGHKTSIDRTRVHLFAPYATQDRSALDVHQNVAYCYKKWVSKTIHLKRNMKRHEAKMGSSQSKLLPLKVGGSDTPRSASDTSFTDDDKSQEQFRGKTASLKRGSIIQSAFRRMSIGFSNLRSYRNSLFQKSASDPKDQKKMQTHEVIGESQTGSLEEKPSESHDRNFSQNQTSGPADDDGDRVDEQSHMVNTVSANNTDNVNAQNNEPASTKTWLLPPEKNQGDRSTTLSAPESTPTDNKKVGSATCHQNIEVFIFLSSFLQKPKATSTASYKPLSSAMPMKNAVTEKKQKKRAHLTEETPCCFCAGVGSRIQNMVHGIVSDIFFELFIDFCIVLNTALMSVKYHGMTERMENSVDTGGMVRGQT